MTGPLALTRAPAVWETGRILGSRRILVVEADFAVALKIHRLLDRENAGGVDFLSSPEEAIRLAWRWSDYDIAIVGVGEPAPPGAGSLIHALCASGSAVVVIAADGWRVTAEASGARFVTRRAVEFDLMAACDEAVAKRRG